MRTATAAVLFLEDSRLDAELIHTRLAASTVPLDVDWVADRPAYLDRLASRRYDLVLADYHVPGFDGLDALHLARTHQSGVPFIVVSGALGEELAIDTLKQGATDYVLKGRLGRLVPAVERALAEAAERAERRTAEARAREKDERLALLVGHATDYAVIIADPDGVVVEWAGGAEAITGWSAGETVGQSIGRIFTAEDRAAGIPLSELRKAARDGRADDRRWHVRKDGSRFYADGVVTALLDDAGRLRGFGKVVRDVTARKRDEERLRLLWEAAAVLLGTDDAQALPRGLFDKIAPQLGLDLYLNFAASEDGAGLRLTSHAGIPEGLTRSAAWIAHGEGVCGRVARDRRPAVLSDVAASSDPAAALARSLGARAYAVYPLAAGAQLLGVLSFGSRTRDRFSADDLGFLETLAHYVAAATDRLQLIARLREEDRKKDEFLATLAHELRNPLAPVRNALEVIRVSPDRPVRERAQGMIDRQLGHLTRLVDDLLDVSRITRGRLVLRRERIELGAVIAQAVETARPVVAHGGHELSVTLPPGPVYLNGDPVRLTQVFSNLLNNAAKYTLAGGRISLAAGLEGSEVVVRVCDTGIGIRPDMLSRVFDLFTQADAALEKAQGGLGIGLTLVRRLVEMHGGSVRAHSDGEGQGSEFVVQLPVAGPLDGTGPVAPTLAKFLPVSGSA